MAAATPQSIPTFKLVLVGDGGTGKVRGITMIISQRVASLMVLLRMGGDFAI